jgi:hypothetical protein
VHLQRDRRGRDSIWLLDLQLSVLVTTNDLTSNTGHGEVYSIQHYLIKFVGEFVICSTILHHNYLLLNNSNLEVICF